jgi:two-component system sensor histidine kinase CpxA
VSAYEAGGTPALAAFEKRVWPDDRMRGYFFDAQLHEVRGREATNNIRALAQRLRQGDPVRFEPDGKGVLAGSLVTGRDGRVYRTVISFVSRRSRVIPVNAWGWAVRIFSVLASTALLCSWLAWRLSTPLGILQQATRKFAAGDLSIRAGSASFPKYPPEYSELARDFDEMGHRIETLVNSQRQLLRDVSHELRTPLTRLSLAVNIARRSPGAAAAESLDRIDQESDRLNALIDRILRLSRLESLAEAPRSDLIELSDFIDSIVSDANFEAEAHNRKVTTLRCETCRLRGDRELLREALENVIRNAIRYAPEGTNVSVESFLAGGSEYRIVVRDRGPGVPPDHLAAIFDPFHRAPQRAGAETGGFGLGLAIAKRAVGLHHGVITGRNCADGGFEIDIELPVETAAAA